MAAHAINTQVTLETEVCCNCGVMFAMPAQMKQNFRTKGGDFYCPSGHAQHYTVPVEVRLKKQLAEQTRTATLQAERAAAAERALKKSQAEGRRLLTRVHAGVCPCCNRTFKQLARHMAAKHPEHKA